jgi:hypothetical protein
VEIVTFLHLSIRRIIALAVLVVLVAVPTAAILLRGPTEYKATANVRMGQFVPPRSASGVTAAAESDFQAALQVPQLQNDLAARAGVPSKRIKDGLGVVIPPQGTTVQVTFTDTNQQRAASIVQQASSAGLSFLARQQVDAATGAVAAADRGVAQALAKLQAFDSTAGAPGASDQLAALAQQALVLEDRERTASSPAELFSVASTLAETKAQMSRLTPLNQAEQPLSVAFNAALAGADAATAQYTAASARLASASSGSAVTLNSVNAVGKLRRTLVYGFGAGLAAALVAVAALAVVELRRRSLPGTDAVPVGRGGVDAGPPPAGPPTVPPLSAPPPTGVGEGPRWATPEALFTGGVLLVVLLSVLIGTAVVELSGVSRTTVALVLSAPIGLAAGILAFTRFEWFLAAMVISRSSLDSFSVTGVGGKTGLDPGVVMAGVFVVAALLWLAAQRRSGRWVPASRSTWSLWVFAAACAISVPTSLTRGGSATSLLKVIAGVLMFSVLEQYLGQRPDRARRLIGCLFLSLVVPATLGFRQLFTHGLTYVTATADFSRVAGSFVDPTSFAVFLVMLLPMAALLVVYARGWARTAAATVLVASGVLLIATYTREAWIAAIISLAYLGIRARREVLYVLVAVVVVLLIAVPSVSSRFADLHASSSLPAGVPNNSLSWRMSYWKSLIPMAGINPVTGIGFDAVERVRPEKLAPHNMFVEAYVETGVVGLAALLGVLWCFTVDLRRRVRLARPGWEALLAMAAVAAALGLLAEFPGENMATQTFVYWYAAVAMTFGLGRLRAPVTGTTDASDDRASEDRTRELVGAG